MIDKEIIEIKEAIEPYHYELTFFKYYKKIFGNIVIEIVSNEKKLTFVCDRGEIYCNGVILSNYDYLKTGKITKFEKMKELIVNYLSKEQDLTQS